MRWTEGQRAAIETQGNLIVSAAAGAGKTAVLTERIVRTIMGGVPVESVLVLTFTRAAAAEMKQRIADRLQRAVGETEDAALRSYLLAQCSAVENASISTIDAFCSRILRRHGAVLGIPGRVRVADEVELAVMEGQVKDALLTELAAKNDPALHTLLAAFGSEDAVWEALGAVESALSAEADPDAWLSGAVARYRDPAYAALVLSRITEGMQLELRAGIAELVRFRDTLPPELGGVIAVLDEDLMRLRALLLQNGYDGYRTGLLLMTFPTMRFPKGTPDADKKPVKDARDSVKALVKKQLAAMPRSAEEETSLLLEAFPIVCALETLVRARIAAYRALKQKRNVVDFSDVEHLAITLLGEDRIAEEYRSKYRVIAVDEYQDSNGVQEALLSRIRRADNLFLVGDVKQSIYRFRAAEPALFLEKLARWQDGREGRRIDLTENFRSAKEVLHAVNAVFTAIMSEQVGEMAYDERVKLIPGTEVPHGGACLHLIPKAVEEDEDPDALEDMEDAAVEARLIAERIRALMADMPVYDAKRGGERPLGYGDIAILLRATTQAQTFAETLALCGIPCYAQSSGGYFDSIEVMVLLNVLRVIDNRRQDIPLLSVLRSPLFGFSEEALLKLRLRAGRDVPFYEAFFSLAASEDAKDADDPLAGQVRETAAALARFREIERLYGVTALLAALLDETGYYERMGALPAGGQRQRNLDALLARAEAFEQTGARGVSRFLASMDYASSNARLGAAQDAAGDVCRIESIHKSKGLEYPVVFVAQMGKRFRLDDGREPLLLHHALGIGLRFRNGICREDTAAYRAILRAKRLEGLSEEMRVLYVAMTRAKQRLELIASTRDADALLERRETAPEPAAVSRAASPLPWLLSGDPRALPIVRHRRSDLLRETPVRPAPAPAKQDAPETLALALRFSYEYPFASSTALPAKQAVSRAAEDARGESAAERARESLRFDPPAFMTGGALTPAMRGTATHLLLERLPLVPASAEDIRSMLAALHDEGVYDESDASGVRAEDVAWFTNTALFARMARSERVQREWSFTLPVPAAELYDTDAPETVLLQGVIDCCFLEDGAWVLLDYKTDRLKKDETPDVHAAIHAAQLALYARALESLTGCAVKARYVVLLRAHAAVEVR